LGAGNANVGCEIGEDGGEYDGELHFSSSRRVKSSSDDVGRCKGSEVGQLPSYVFYTLEAQNKRCIFINRTVDVSGFGVLVSRASTTLRGVLYVGSREINVDSGVLWQKCRDSCTCCYSMTAV
jgi:hypothetical protein